MTDAERFLKMILAAEGLKIACLKLARGMHQQIARDVEELIEILMRGNAQGLDTYHACATYKNEHGVWDEKKKKNVIRTAANIAWLMALWLDIDVGAKGYATLEEAWRAVEAFRQRVGLPPPTYVVSGGGLHVYWPLGTPLVYDQWLPLATTLKALATLYGLRQDPTRTADGASILRTPGTKNFKYSPARAVELGELTGPYPVEIFERLTQEMGDVQRASRETEPTRTTNHVGGNGATNISASGSSRTLAAATAAIYGRTECFADNVVRECGQLANVAANGRQLNEPTWYAACGILAYCEDGAERAHGWGAGYGGFDRKDTDKWLDDKMAQWRAATTGPTTCKQWESLHPEICQACALNGQITTPCERGGRKAHAKSSGDRKTLQIRGTTNAALHDGAKRTPYQVNGHAVDLPMLPENWQFGEHGELELAQEDRDGNSSPLLISRYPIYLDTVHRGEIRGEHSYRFRSFLPHGGWRDIMVDASDLFGQAGISTLAAQGVVIHEPKHFFQFSRDMVDAYNYKNPVMTQYEQFGWKDNYTKFLLGNKLYCSDGSVQTAVGNKEVSYRCSIGLGVVPPNASLKAWSDAAGFLFGAGNESQSVMFLSGFAAPLISFYGQDEGGAILHNWSKATSRGKTVACMASASIYGTWDSLRLVNIDTKVSQGMTLGVLSNLPVFFDEFNNIDPSIAKEFVEIFTNGRDKMRADASGDFIKHKNARWNTLLGSAANVSFIDIIKSQDRSNAMMYRILEMPAEKFLMGNEGEKWLNQLKANAAIAGHTYISWLVQPQSVAWVKQALDKWTNDIWRMTGLPKDYRFRVRAVAAIAVAATIVYGLGLINFDPQRIINYLINLLKEGAADAEMEKKPIEWLSAYIHENISSTLVVQDKFVPRTQCRVLRSPIHKLFIRYEVDPDMIYVDSSEFRKWLIKHGENINDVLTTLIADKVVIQPFKLVTLAAGVKDLLGGQTRCLVIDGTGLIGVTAELRKPTLVSPSLAQRASQVSPA
jgi:hypothetical protein